MALSYYIIDTETTGLKAGFHEVIQASIIRCEDQFQKTINIRAENPSRASKEALQVTKKTYADLSQGIERKDAVEQMLAFMQEDGKTSDHRCVVAHNAAFDRRFLHAMFEASNAKFPANLWLCTRSFSNKLAKRLGVVKPKLTLEASMERAGVKIRKGAHNATVDTLNTYDLWSKLMNENLGHVSIIKRVPHGETV